MGYTTREILKDRLDPSVINIAKEYGDDLGTPIEPQAVNWDMVDREIERQSRYIDAKIGAFYTVPLSAPINAEVAEWCYYLVACQLFHTPTGIPPDIEKNCEEAKKALDEVSEGSRDITGLPKINGIAEAIDPHPDLEAWDAREILVA